MRAMRYVVEDNDGRIFDTASYSNAMSGHRIIKTYLVPVDERTEEEKKQAREHARKVQEVLRLKRA